MSREDDFLQAAEYGDYEQVKQYVKNGVNINYANENNTTALHFAAWNGWQGIARFLIQKGIDTRLVEGKNWSAIHDAVRKENSDMVLTILSTAFGLENTAEYEKMFYNLSNKRDEHFRELLRLIEEYGFTRDAVGICGNSLLDDARKRRYTKSL